MKKVFWFSCILACCTLIPGMGSGEEKDGDSVAGLTPGYFSKEALNMADYDYIQKTITAALDRAKTELPQAEKLAERTKNTAIAKRIEIFRKLQSYVERLQGKTGREWQLFAWQGAEELKQMLDYFELEAERAKVPRKAEKIFNLRDYGAKGDGKHNDTPALRKAFEEAKAFSGQAKIFIPKGDYLLEPEDLDPLKPVKFTSYRFGKGVPEDKLMWGKPMPHLQLVGTTRLTIEGEKGTKLLFADPTRMGLLIIGADDMLLRNLVIDYRNRCFTQGKIIALNPQDETLDFQVAPGYPALDLYQFTNAPSFRITAHEGKERRYKIGTYVIENVTRIGANTFRLTSLKTRRVKQNEPWGILKSGMVASIIARYEGRSSTSAIDFRFSRFCTVEDFVILGSPAQAIKAGTGYAQSLIRYQIKPRDPSDLVSTNGDALCPGGASPIGPYIADCDFSYMEDDAINISSRSPEIAKVSPDGSANVPYCEGADAVWVLDLESGMVEAVARVIDNHYVPRLPDTIRSTENMKLKKMTGEEKSKLGYTGCNAGKFKKRPHRIIPLNGSTNGSVILDTKVTFLRGRGIQISSPNMLVEGCEFRELTCFGMMIGPLMPYGIAVSPHNVTVKNCHFESLGAHAIWAINRGLGAGSTIKASPMGDIFIEGNTFVYSSEFRKPFMTLANCYNVQVHGNTFRNITQEERLFYIDSAFKISFADNNFQGKIDQPMACFKYGSNVDAKQSEIIIQ